MKAILLSAGLGTRLRPITNNIPKCLVPINGKPLIDFWLEMIEPHASFDEVLINLYYFEEKVRSHLATHWKVSKKISLWPESSLKGTAGTLINMAENLKGQTLMVVHADNLSYFDLNTFLNAHQNRPQNCAITMMLFHSDDPQNCGIVEISDDNRVIHMHEKVENPPGNLANAAVYIFESEVLDWIIKNGVTDISQEVIPAFIGRINAWQNNQYHRDIGNPESYSLAQTEFLIYQN